MNETKVRKKIHPGKLFALCPIRHVLFFAGVLLIAFYFAFRNNAAAMEGVSRIIVRPWHGFASGICDALPFSAGEALISLGVVFALVYITLALALLILKPGRAARLYRLCMTILSAFCLIYGGFCLLWGPYYYTADFEKQSGIVSSPISTEQLETVTRYFTDLANEYGTEIPRDENGVFAADMDAVFDYAPGLYGAVEEICPCLEGESRNAKQFFFSRILSYVGFSGFFFPFTGEANINCDSPDCFVPSTIAHEYAHQRGVAAEDEANFVAVLACLSDGDPVYCYSAALKAYVHLGNALYKADYEAWEENYRRLSPGVRADLESNNVYWKQFETPVGEASDAVYTGFLQSYGQELGLQTYGACVDLLVAYYYEIASAR